MILQMKIKYSTLGFSIFTPLFAGFLGSYFTAPFIPTWYSTLNKPFFNPPNFIFAPVWTTLYILMGISLYLVIVSKSKKDKILSYKYFFTQLILNTLWSIIFFGMQNPTLAFVEIIILWIFIYKTICEFKKINTTASYLLYPYLAWVSFASLLNLAIVVLN